MTDTSRTQPPASFGAPSSYAAPGLAERLNLRALLFAIVLLGPVMGLTWVYFDRAMGTGIKELPDGYLYVDLQRMSNFVFDQRHGTIDDVPEQWRELDGRKVVLDGEMWVPNMTFGDVQRFELVYSIANCCYVDEPQIQHFVQSRVAEEGTVRLYSRPVRVRGTLHVDVTREAGEVTGVYHLDVEEVRPL